MGKEIDKTKILNRIKEYYSLSGNSELARFLDIAPNTVTNWYNRNSIDFDIVFTKCEGLDKNWLLSGTPTVVLNSPLKNNGVNIPIVDISAAAGMGYFNGDNIIQETSIALPGKMLTHANDVRYCIRIKGQSMSPTLQDSDYVIVRLLDRSEWENFTDGLVYMVVTKDGVSFIKRVKNRLKKGFIVMMSDNIEKREYPNFNIQADEIHNIFIAEWHLSAKMQNINETYYYRLKMLEDDVDELKDKFKSINNK